MDKKTILIIDDVKFNIRAAQDVLGDDYKVIGALSAEAGMKVLSHTIPDLILLDIIMPETDGHQVLKILKGTPRYMHIPVIFLTADSNYETEVEGFNEGIVDYITKPFVADVLKKRIQTQIELAEYQRSMEDKVNEKIAELEDMYDLLAVSFAALTEYRDSITGGHLKNTSIYFKAFIEHLADSDNYRDQLNPSIVAKAIRSAPLHDVGKIAVNDSVLQKPGSLTDQEFERIKLHSVIGGELFSFIGQRVSDKEFADIAYDICRYHHEKWDGTGYPEGLAGKDIPLLARIMSIVDVYDALTSERPYKKALSHEKSMAIIAERSGRDFDPGLVNEFINISPKIEECLKAKETGVEAERYFKLPKHIFENVNDIHRITRSEN
ncbi:putative two-component system response regulator [Lachnospiraceae bacterium XBB2008]|nr:putative two-component system response regulator [Lachnospiraceae bacterium XBB2008]